MSSGPFPGVPGSTYSFSQIQQLWLNNGGDPRYASIMAAIAEAESGGQTNVLNNTPATGDYSVGLWQINYYGNLLNGRTAEFGSPESLAADPNAQAKAAITLQTANPGLTDWQGDAAWKQWQADGSPVPWSVPPGMTGGGGSGPGNTDTLTSATTSGGSSTGCSGCAVGLPSVLGIGGGCLISHCNLKALKGGLLIIGGGAIFTVGALVLVAYGFTRTGAGRAAAQAYDATPARTVLRKAGASRAASARLEQTRASEEVRTEHAMLRSEHAASARRYGAATPASSPGARRHGPSSGRRRATAKVNDRGEEWF